jgi:hypothetical protein
MSESIIGDDSWNRMTEAEKTAVVVQGRATLRHLTEGLLDGPEQLRNACREVLISTGTALEGLPINGQPTVRRPRQRKSTRRSSSKTSRPVKVRTRRSRIRISKQRFGLPNGFVPRLQRYGRMILLEGNVYRLPNGQEFVPGHPTGTLGRIEHLYALLTMEQHEKGKRGSVYIRTDGKIFDYSFDQADPEREIFETAYTIQDLERTGRYTSASRLEKKIRPAKGKAH